MVKSYVEIGRLYRRTYEDDKGRTVFYEQDTVITTAIKEIDGEILVSFFYLDDPDEECLWNLAAFQDGMVELDECEITT